MKDVYLKFLGILLVVMILIFSISIFITQKGIEEINEDIEKVNEKPLSVSILSDTSSGTSPLTVNFKPLLINSRNKIEYFWDFGDGNTSKEEKPVYVYQDDGVFCCKLTIKDGNTTVTDSFNVTVLPNNPPKIKILCKNTDFRPTKLFFDCEAFDPEGEELTYHWVLRYPLIMGVYEQTENFYTKNFSKRVIRNGGYIVELTVTDESGNKAVDYETVQVKVSQIEGVINNLGRLYTVTLPGQLELIWKILNLFNLEKNLDKYWFNMTPIMQNIIIRIIGLSFGRIKYEPPIPKADLEVPEIADINLSAYIDDITGKALAGAVASSSFAIINNDTLNTARNVYITLKKPFSNDEGLDDDIEVKDLTVSLDVGAMSNKMFYNGRYTSWENCHNIEKLAPGDFINLGITVTLNEGSIFNKGSYPCKIYIYQEKYLDDEKYVDQIPFKIII